jgi:hypothetical protein
MAWFGWQCAMVKCGVLYVPCTPLHVCACTWPACLVTVQQLHWLHSSWPCTAQQQQQNSTCPHLPVPCPLSCAATRTDNGAL